MANASANASAMRLVDHVWRVAHGAARRTDAILSLTYEISLPQLLALRAIIAAVDTKRGALCGKDLARELRCSAANASELVAALVRKRWLTKARDTENRRVVRLHPTVAGREAEYHASDLLADCARRALEPMSALDQQILVVLLENVTLAAFS